MSYPSPGIQRSKCICAVFSLLVIFAQLSYSGPNIFPGIKIGNFGQVNENYYRGGQPYAADCVALKKLGIKTVIDLQKNSPFQESAWVQNAGMQYFNIPLSSSHPATTEQTEYFLKLANDPSKWPVYVHCAGGRHRTGGMTAVYRIANDSWTADQACKEMKDYHYYAFPNHGSWKDYVFGYYRDFQTKTHNASTSPASADLKPASAAGAANQRKQEPGQDSGTSANENLLHPGSWSLR
jgi:protein tyrosine/serine phosphatase